MIRNCFISLLLPMVSPFLLFTSCNNNFFTRSGWARRPPDSRRDAGATLLLARADDRAQRDPDSQGQPFVGAEVSGHERNHFHQDHQPVRPARRRRQPGVGVELAPFDNTRRRLPAIPPRTPASRHPRSAPGSRRRETCTRRYSILRKSRRRTGSDSAGAPGRHGHPASPRRPMANTSRLAATRFPLNTLKSESKAAARITLTIQREPTACSKATAVMNLSPVSSRHGAT